VTSRLISTHAALPRDHLRGAVCGEIGLARLAGWGHALEMNDLPGSQRFVLSITVAARAPDATAT
jgi:hypothetical protein